MIATAKCFANNTLSNKEKTFVQVVRVCVITEDESFPRASEAQIDVEFLFFQNKIWACAYHELHYCMFSSKKPYYLVITNYKSDRIKKTLFEYSLLCGTRFNFFHSHIRTSYYKDLRKSPKIFEKRQCSIFGQPSGDILPFWKFWKGFGGLLE